ncbi:(d)CMP kinase [Urechidicola vernalis]|uniref:Cytidylate kinase n=1 Tax=Urechidicola vernalis TaxID=3075600 RepID=A0ABU2Y1W1_9FLAO|nr:(d)CMP kinase [Urechidicola sp. P050]MDT0551624.1 (d)CMP kinase [Urechidicola sp. P050]
MKKITIAIDGFSSTGKSTLAKQLAKKLKYVYVDTGAMYRAVTLYAFQNGFIDNSSFDEKALIADLDSIKIHFVFNSRKGFAEVFLNDVNVEKEIRTLEVSQLVSQVSAVSEVRTKLVQQQQEMRKDNGIVMDGRDIGTVVFPDADIKFFMTASADKRAKRRYKELLDRGEENITYERVLKNVESRDYIDSTREDSPLVKADDAIGIDNSDMGLEEQFDRVYNLILRYV